MGGLASQHRGRRPFAISLKRQDKGPPLVHSCAQELGITMRVLMSALALLISFGLAVAGAADKWQSVRDPVGAWSIEFPQSPTVEHNATKTSGHATPYAQYAIDLGESALIFMDSDFSATPHDGLKAIRGGAKAVEKGKTVVSDAAETLDGHVGRSIKMSDGEHLFTDRIFYVNDHLYQAITVLPLTPSSDQSALADRFNSSFHLK
jgi:hypothetical protein